MEAGTPEGVQPGNAEGNSNIADNEKTAGCTSAHIAGHKEKIKDFHKDESSTKTHIEAVRKLIPLSTRA